MDSTLNAQIEAAKAYESLFVPALFYQWASRIANQLNIQPEAKVLDVACGTGVLAREIATKMGGSGEITGLDPLPGMLAVAKEIQPSINWQQGNAESLPFENDYFDVVVSQFGMMFFTDRSEALQEMWRVLRPEGTLIIAVWDQLENTPAYAKVVAMLQREVGRPAAEALNAPYILGKISEVKHIFLHAGLPTPHIQTYQGTAHFPSIQMMVEADLRGWLPVMGVHLSEEQIAVLLNKAEDELNEFLTDGANITFDAPAHIISLTKTE